ncbi:MAG: isoaspartyl peptidase/L-asparaginase [Bacteroidetes bacterium]|nr:MAG: isoaspartyl peptidase/L-asparaginase [Bacteroidota bacterium]
MKHPLALAIHGGAGTIRRHRMTPEAEARYRAGLEAALQVGYAVLARGGHALDAAEAAVLSLEDNPLFNAGKGAVYAHDGTHRFDAAVMRGDTRQAGSVACIRGVRNPIRLARLVMEQSAYVMMVGPEAEDFARLHGLPFEDTAYFHDELRYQQWLRVKDSDQMTLDHSDKGEKNYSTVGAVACDRAGNLAAATSTGGMTNKRFGRVGDSPIIGAGTYADNATCAISATGHGEPFMRAVVAHDVAALMAYRGLSLAEATAEVIHHKLPGMHGSGGLIAVDAQGQVALPFNCEGMYRGSWQEGGLPVVRIFGDE